MLRILDKDKAPIKGLRVYKDYCIEGVLDLNNKTLSFSAPLDFLLYSLLRSERKSGLVLPCAMGNAVV